ncbi:MAG: hypothetical protein JNM38_19980 [Acidobacteria bacterium]|nr:hypothetical protein [Acidobacteriota bacterium]
MRSYTVATGVIGRLRAAAISRASTMTAALASLVLTAANMVDVNATLKGVGDAWAAGPALVPARHSRVTHTPAIARNARPRRAWS